MSRTTQSRRDFLGKAGLATLLAGLAPAVRAFPDTDYGGPPTLLSAPNGSAPHIAVLGAGIAGLVAAYELERAGYRVTVIEARERVGGRVWTIRRGDKVETPDGAAQVADWSGDSYLNAGAARIPSFHRAVLGYCRDLGIPLEPVVNTSRSNLSRLADGRLVRNRQLIADTKGLLAEFLARGLASGALQGVLPPGFPPVEAVIGFLKYYADLGDDGHYHGSLRAGYATLPGLGDQRGVAVTPLDMKTLLDPALLAPLILEDLIEMQSTMLQPVGGMDRIPMAFAKAIRSPILLGTEVSRIIGGPDKVEIQYRRARDGTQGVLTADQAIVTLPLPILAGIQTNFPAEVKRAIAATRMSAAIKVAFDTPRFWEAEGIYGGMSYTGAETQLLWYPSMGFHSANGVLVAAYSLDAAARSFARHDRETQIAMARAAVDGLHPGQAARMRSPLVVDWLQQKFSQGPWLDWAADGNDASRYALLGRPIGRVRLAGGHLSQYAGHWQEGAVLSGQAAALAAATFR